MVHQVDNQTGRTSDIGSSTSRTRQCLSPVLSIWIQRCLIWPFLVISHITDNIHISKLRINVSTYQHINVSIHHLLRPAIGDSQNIPILFQNQLSNMWIKPSQLLSHRAEIGHTLQWFAAILPDSSALGEGALLLDLLCVINLRFQSQQAISFSYCLMCRPPLHENS